MTPEERAKACYCDRSEVIAWHIRDAIREAYEDAAKIAEEYAYGKGWSHTYIGELTAAIRARIKGN
jgi:hypothetical protein